MPTDHQAITTAAQALKGQLWAAKVVGLTDQEAEQIAAVVARAEQDRLRTLIAPLRLAYKENGMETVDVAWVDGFHEALDAVLALLGEPR